MNPNYVKVLEFITKLESEIKIKVKTKQISSDEWEQKNINQDNQIQLNTDSTKQTQNEDSNVISEALTQSNNDKFDFFDVKSDVLMLFHNLGLNDVDFKYNKSRVNILVSDTIVGVVRKQHSFVDLDGNRYVALGTDKFLLVYFEGQLHDVTPLKAT